MSARSPVSQTLTTMKNITLQQTKLSFLFCSLTQVAVAVLALGCIVLSGYAQNGDPLASVTPGGGGWIWANQNGDFSGSASISSGTEVDVYAFMPDVTGNYVISTGGSLDSQLRIYNSAGAAITGVIDSSLGGETTTQSFTAGSWYYIAVAGYLLNPNSEVAR